MEPDQAAAGGGQVASPEAPWTPEGRLIAIPGELAKLKDEMDALVAELHSVTAELGWVEGQLQENPPQEDATSLRQRRVCLVEDKGRLDRMRESLHQERAALREERVVVTRKMPLIP